jgi:hypothetical protein
VTTLADLGAGQAFMFVAQVTAIDGAGTHLSLFGPASAAGGSALMDPGGVLTGQLTSPADQIPVTVVTQFVTVSVGDVLASDSTGETMVARSVTLQSLPPRGPDWRTALRARTVRLARRLGHRGAFLGFLAILDFSYGYALLSTSVSALRASPDLMLPPDAWGWIWVAVGVLCLSGAASRHDWPQFVAASTLKGAWAAVYADIWIVQHGTNAWVSVVVWASFALTVLVVASWPEPVRL